MRGFFYNQREMEKAKRIDFIDIGRCFAMLLIFLLHVLQRTYPNFTSTWGSVYILVFSVTPFFFLSGMVYANKAPLRPIGFLYDILKRGFAYFLPFIWFLLFRVLIYGQWKDFPTAFSEILDYPVSGLWVCWILLWTVIFVDIGLLIARACPRFKVLCVALSVAIAYTVLIILRKTNVIGSDHFLGYDYFMVYVPVFLVGYLIGNRVFRFDNLVVSTVCIAVGLGGLVPIAINNLVLIQVGFLSARWMFHLGSLCAMIAWYGLLSIWKNLRWMAVFALGGRYTMEAYLVHLIVLKNWGYLGLADGWQIFGMTIGLFLLCIASTAAVTIVSYWVPFLHFALFGRHYSHYGFENALFENLKKACLSK